MGEDPVKELTAFLKIDSRYDVKTATLQTVLGLTGSEDGRQQLLASQDLLAHLKQLIADDPSPASKDACLVLLNLSGHASAATPLLAAPGPETARLLLSHAVRADSPLADKCCMTLANLSRTTLTCRRLWQSLQDSEVTVERLVRALCQRGYNTAGAKLDYLGPLLSNLTQLPEARKYLLDREQVVFQRLLPFTEYQDSLVRRGGVVGAIKNCCFDTDAHSWLLGDDVDLAPRLLLPLTGPEQFDDEDMEQLAADLQYMDDNKSREPDVDIRKMLLEALTQLCATRASRETVRSKGAYLILREYHKWEKHEETLNIIEHLVNILIQTEEEIGVDDYKSVDIPSEVADSLEQQSTS